MVSMTKDQDYKTTHEVVDQLVILVMVTMYVAPIIAGYSIGKGVKIIGKRINMTSEGQA